jgi:CubicO group peptidase (beta-lactamase class C family)
MTMMRVFLACFFLLASTAASADEIELVAAEIAAGKIDGVTAMTLSIDGAVVADVHARGGAPKPYDIRSATKSITALLIGALIGEGKLASVEESVAALVPAAFADIPEGDERRKITVENLLTMRSGLACDDCAPASVGHEDKMYETKNWTAFLLSQPFAHERGKHFSYCTGGVVLLGRVIEALSGESVPEFAARTLFAPLGISKVRWEKIPEGGADTGGHLRISASDLEKIGRLVLRRGQWDGRQILPADWIEAATKKQTDVTERKFDYGYLWWLDNIERDGIAHPVVFAMGNGGNFIFVLPNQQAIVAFTAKNFNSPQQFLPATLLRERILPALLARQESR